MKKGIQTINDYFESTINSLPLATNIVLLLDPENFLDFDEEYIDVTNGKKWNVLHYYGNDLTFRRKYSSIKEKGKPIILWITKPTSDSQKINLSYIYDIIEKTEKIIDLSLKDVLSKIIPGVTWPEEIFEHSKEIGQELSRFHSLYQTLRKELPAKAPLNINHAKALLIALRNPQISMSDLIIGSIAAQEALDKYTKIVLYNDLNEKDKKLLQEIIENNVVEGISEITPWFQLDKDDLAIFLYLLDLAKRYKMINPIIQLRGIGLLSFDPEILGEKRITKTFENVESQPETRLQIIKITEKKLEPKQINKVLECLELKDSETLEKAIQNETLPLIVYALCINYLAETVKKKELRYSNLAWTKSLSKHPIIVEKIETEYSQKAICLLNLMIDTTSILQSLESRFETKNDLATLIDWWRDSDIFKIELAIANAINYLQSIYDDNLRKTLDNYIQQLKKDVRAKLELADLNLASLIEKNWKGYLSHPRVATNIIRDYIVKRKINPSKDRKIWILIFDGMRLDTWEQIVKPIMTSRFEIKEEKLYLSMLPSETDIARVSILAGVPPAEWCDYEGGYTSDHNILASKLFGLSRYEGREKLRVTVSSETDFGQKRLDEGVYLYNVLIYNVSDDWIHTFRGDIRELNYEIEGTLRRKIMPDLDRRINEEDYVILTSDHGYIELSPEDEIKVYVTTGGTPPKQMISYRCMKNVEHIKGYRLGFTPHEFFTVAKGRKWFSRPKSKFSRYAHGGISLDEMVVPGVLMEKIATARVELILTCPDTIELTEDFSSEVNVKIENTGNKRTEFDLSLRTNTGEEEKHSGSINPKESQEIIFKLAKPTLPMKHLEISLAWKTPEGKLSKPSKKIIPIKVKERKDKVEFKFGGLDNIKE